MKKVLLVLDGYFHPPFLGRLLLRKVLSRESGYQFQQARSMDQSTAIYDHFSALVLYFHHKKISDQAINAFDEYIRSGGGVLAIHSATASAKENDAFTDILGGKFIGHGPVKSFSIRPVIPKSEIFKGVPEFQVKDELYMHALQPDIKVHYTTIHEGQEIPMVWTRKHGEGRVCYACPGHTAGSMRSTDFQQVLLHGLDWVCDDG